MANDTIITVIGNLTADPELRFSPSGSAVANFTIAQTPRIKKGDEWVDGETLFLRASIWREAAENVATSLTKGARVIAQGALKQRSYETREGEKRTSYELDVLEIGPSLARATAVVTRVDRNGAPKGGPSGPPSSGGWNTNAPAAGGDAWSGSGNTGWGDQESPF